MAGVLAEKTEVGLVKKTNEVEGMDENNWSKLMYYINCVATVLRMDDDADITRLRQYRQFRSLTNQDKDKILIFCTLLAPEVLENKCIFQKDSMCHEFLNEFYDLNIARTQLVITEDVLIGGSRKAVTKIMCYTKFWLKDNYTDPYNTIIRDRQAPTSQRSQPTSQSQPPATGNPTRGGAASGDSSEKKTCIVM